VWRRAPPPPQASHEEASSAVINLVPRGVVSFWEDL
jgi:hypothetical protein